MRCRCSRVSATVLAVLLVGGDHEARRRPRRTSDRPSTCTGIDGPASLTCSPWSSIRARTVPHAAPATSGSPTRSVPRSHEDGRDRTPPDVEVGLEHDARAGPRGWPGGPRGRRRGGSARAGRRCRGPASADTSTVIVSPPKRRRNRWLAKPDCRRANSFCFTEIPVKRKIYLDRKYFCFKQNAKSALYLSPSRPDQRGDHDRHDRGTGMRWTPEGCNRRAQLRAYGKDVWSDAAVLASMLLAATPSRRYGGKRAVLRGEPVISRKATAQGMSDVLAALYAHARTPSCTLRMRPRVQRASGIPAPSGLKRAKSFWQTSGTSCREIANAYDLHPVIPGRREAMNPESIELRR